MSQIIDKYFFDLKKKIEFTFISIKMSAAAIAIKPNDVIRTKMPAKTFEAVTFENIDTNKMIPLF